MTCQHKNVSKTNELFLANYYSIPCFTYIMDIKDVK